MKEGKAKTLVKTKILTSQGSQMLFPFISAKAPAKPNPYLDRYTLLDESSPEEKPVPKQKEIVLPLIPDELKTCDICIHYVPHPGTMNGDCKKFNRDLVDALDIHRCTKDRKYFVLNPDADLPDYSELEHLLPFTDNTKQTLGDKLVITVTLSLFIAILTLITISIFLKP